MEPTVETQGVCPTCARPLTLGSAVLTSLMQATAAYLCEHCRIIYTRDLQPRASMVG